MVNIITFFLHLILFFFIPDFTRSAGNSLKKKIRILNFSHQLVSCDFHSIVFFRQILSSPVSAFERRTSFEQTVSRHLTTKECNKYQIMIWLNFSTNAAFLYLFPINFSKSKYWLLFQKIPSIKLIFLSDTIKTLHEEWRREKNWEEYKSEIKWNDVVNLKGPVHKRLPSLDCVFSCQPQSHTSACSSTS